MDISLETSKNWFEFSLGGKATTLMSIPLVFSFWFMVAAYVIHVIDESLLGGSFCREGPRTLVAPVFLDKVLLVQQWLLWGYDCQRHAF